MGDEGEHMQENVATAEIDLEGSEEWQLCVKGHGEWRGRARSLSHVYNSQYERSKCYGAYTVCSCMDRRPVE